MARRGLNGVLRERAEALVGRVHALGGDLGADLSCLMREAGELLKDSDAPSLRDVPADVKRLAPRPGTLGVPQERLTNLYEALSDCMEHIRWTAAAGAILIELNRQF